MFLYSNIIGAVFLGTEAILAYFAFSSLTNFCVKPEEIKDESFVPHFPCKVSGLYNENFLALPGIGQICNFYPMMNIAAVPILNITLRNNLLEVLPIKKWIRNSGRCLFLLDDHKNSIKGLWSIILTIPVLIVVMFFRDVQILVTYTGGICGAFIMLLFPAIMVSYARTFKVEDKLGQQNYNKSPF